ncbi:MAG TPA: orotate phosphoribosyltransferase [Bacteroidales bacterium]|nr:orotate phosphoribosyltransferase [Bacteroidales bacterium]HRZ76393.1 orotate phosphoribosyltransferase [Bacteroidales bacterium]
MNSRDETALAAAEFLLQIKAIKLSPDKPFTWASGMRSPIYCDNRKILSYPRIRTFVRQEMARIISEEFGTPDVIAGVATGGIAIGALVAQDLGLPFVYVRSSAKEHGLTNQIEGVLEQGQSIVVVEDLVSTGKSSLAAVEAVKDAGCTVKGMVAIFTYGLQKALDSFGQAGCTLHTLTDYPTLLRKGVEAQYISAEQEESLQEWRKDPQAWSDAQAT